MSESLAQERIDSWSEGPLDLSELGLSSVPENLTSLTGLTDLRLDSNELKSLPESIGNLTNLTALRLDSNELKSLPESIGNLTNLTLLQMQRNQLSSVPESVGNLINLTALRLDSNELKSVPESLGNLTKLTVLSLHVNELSSVPEAIGNLTNLKLLQLDLNQLSSMPESIGNLTDLTALSLFGNQLESMPESIGKLTNLTELQLSSNKLSSISESLGNLTNLTELQLSRNQLSSMPENIGSLTALARLALNGNKLSALPVSVTNLTRITSLDMAESPSATPEGSVALGGNRWGDEFRQAASHGIEALWEYLRTGSQLTDKEPINEDLESTVTRFRESADPISVADLVPDIPVPLELTEPSSPEGRALVGQYEKLIGQVDTALANGVWESDLIVEANVKSNRDNLRQNLYESPGAVDLALTGALAKNLGRQLIEAIVPEGDLKDLASSLLAVGDAEDPVTQVQQPADKLAEAAASAGSIPAGLNPFEWTVEALGWTVEHPAVAAAGTFTTVGTAMSAAFGLTAIAAGVVGIAFGLTAGTLAYAGRIYRQRSQQDQRA